MGDKVKKAKGRKPLENQDSAGEKKKSTRQVKAAGKGNGNRASATKKSPKIQDVAAQAALAIDRARVAQAERGKIQREKPNAAPETSASVSGGPRPATPPRRDIWALIPKIALPSGRKCHCPGMALALAVVSIFLVYELWFEQSEPDALAVEVQEEEPQQTVAAVSNEQREVLTARQADAAPHTKDNQPALPEYTSARDLSDRVNLAAEKTSEWTVAIEKQDAPIASTPPLAQRETGPVRERQSVPPVATRNQPYYGTPTWQPPQSRWPAYRQPEAKPQENAQNPRFGPVWRM